MKFEFKTWQTVHRYEEISVIVSRKELIETLYDVLEGLVREELDLMTDKELLDYAVNALRDFYCGSDFQDRLMDFPVRSESNDEDIADSSDIEGMLLQ